MNVRSAVTSALSALTFLCVHSANARAAAIGQATSVVPATTYARGSATQELRIQEPLEQNDRVKTLADGSTQIRFIDDTILTIGPDSEVLLDQMIFDGNKAKNATVELVRGTMRFVSGTSDRSAYQIKTPVAMIGVRGSVMDFSYFDGRLFFNAVDGIGIVCHGIAGCKEIKAGDSPISVNGGGFSPATLREAALVWRKLDGSHLALARQIGQNPSGAIGAATTIQGDQDITGSLGSNTGNTGNSNLGNSNSSNSNSTNTGGQGDKSSLGPSSGGAGGQTYSTPPQLIAPLLTNNPIVPGNTVGTGVGPAFPPSITTYRVTGAGGPDINSDVLDSHTSGGDSSYIFAARSSVTWDANNTDIRSFTLNQNSSASATLTRTTAQVVDVRIGTDGGGVPIYYLASITNGQIQYADTLGVSDTFTLNSNQLLSILAWGYTGPLFPGPINFGTIVNFSLEAASRPSWSDGHIAPGSFAGTLAVGIGSAALHFGVTATVTMADGQYSFSNFGGPFARTIGLTGDNGRAHVDNLSVTATGPGCNPGCVAFVDFAVVYAGKVGIDYQIEVTNSNSNNSPKLSGVAVFGSPVVGAGTAITVLSFVDTYNVDKRAIGRATGSLDSNFRLTNFNFTPGFATGTDTRTRLTALSADGFSVPGVLSVERWTNGTFSDGSSTFNVPIDGGVHFVYGIPAPFQPISPVVAQFSLTGGTSPTVGTGSASPGTLQSGQVAVDFSNATLKLGVNLFVAIGGGVFQIQSAGGTSGPSLPFLAPNNSIGANAFLTPGRPIDVTVLTSGAIACTSGNCKAGLSGFLAGADTSAYAPFLGLSYSFGDLSALSPQLVSGAAIFRRDFPAGNVAAYVFGPNDFGVGGGNVNLVADPSTPSTFALDFVNVNFGNGNSSNFNRNGPSPAGVADQGSIAGILTWERWTNGNVFSNAGATLLSANQGLHIIQGIAATNIPTTGSYIYTLAGATKPTVVNGSVAPGTMSGTMNVNFATLQAGANLNVAFGSQNYGLNKSGMAIVNNTFGASSIPITASPGATLCTGVCTGQLGGFLAGNQAAALGVFYQITGNNPNTAISGVGAFKR